MFNIVFNNKNLRIFKLDDNLEITEEINLEIENISSENDSSLTFEIKPENITESGVLLIGKMQIMSKPIVIN